MGVEICMFAIVLIGLKAVAILCWFGIEKGSFICVCVIECRKRDLMDQDFVLRKLI